MSTLSKDQIVQCTDAIAKELAEMPGGLLPMLHKLQDTLGYVPQESVPVLAKALNLSRAEVHGVITFYHHFRSRPGGKRTLYVCRSEACQSVGGAELEAHAKQVLGVDWHGTTGDKEITLEPIYCLGNCACAPAVMLDEQVLGNVTPAKLDKLIDNTRT